MGKFHYTNISINVKIVFQYKKLCCCCLYYLRQIESPTLARCKYLS